ncbi:MAG: peptidoglycan DD-metalloendopeptidase family protein [Pseudonocardiaceae bacterium]
MSTGKKVLIVVVALAIAAIGALVTVPLIIVTGLLGASTAAAGCTPGGGPLAGSYNGTPVGGLSPLQMRRAAAVVAQGQQMGIPDRGIIIALAVASQESGFKVYANDGAGTDLAADQRGISASLRIPHDAVGTDHGSLGVFQQQWPWWGDMSELMDPATSARLFYEALNKVAGWQRLEVTVAAQRVQRSAYPSAYADDESLATQLLAAISANAADTGDTANAADSDDTGAADATSDEGDSGTSVLGVGGVTYTLQNGVYLGGVAACDTGGTGAVTGKVAFPLTGRDYVDQHSYGAKGENWDDYHTGSDFSVACGTPVVAATSGTVILKSGDGWAWSGNWLVQIQSGGPGSLTTWYAHMQKLDVAAGQKVTAGQRIGEVGTLGNSTGCHLHFEVHPHGGGFAEDDVDPGAWLQNNVGKTLKGARTLPASRQADDDESDSGERSAQTVSVLTYNIKHGSIAKRAGGLESLAQEITTSGAGIVVLQEADNHGAGSTAENVQWLAHRLGMQAAYAVNGRFRGKDTIDNAILSRYPLSSPENTRLPGSSSIQPRGLLHVAAQLDDGGLIHVYGSHLHFTGAIRQTQAAKIRDHIGTPECAAILAGDMNTTPNTAIHRALTTHLADPFASGKHGRGLTSPSSSPKARIDYLLHDTDTKVTAAEVMAAGDSDHRAVRATLDVTETCQ